MIIVIRIAGQPGLSENIKEALFRLRLRRKYSAVLLKPTQENLKLLKKLRNHIAYGPINNETLSELLKIRAVPKQSKPENIIAQLEKKNLSDLKIKPFFRLHPPRKGIDAKLHFPIRKGVLGDNKEKINDLIRRML
jgi:large subunit ribosomal protein L30